MARNKRRLQLALYSRPKHPGSYHYSLFIAPKAKTPPRSSDDKKQPLSVTKLHVKNTMQNVNGDISQPWRFERILVPDLLQEQRLLVRVTVAKIVSLEGAEQVLARVPIYQADDADQVKAESFNCVSWVEAALDELRVSGGIPFWEEIHRGALAFLDEKKAEGRGEVGCGMGWRREHPYSEFVGKE